MKKLLTSLVLSAFVLASSCSKKSPVFNSVVDYVLYNDSIVEKLYSGDSYEALLAYHNGQIDAFAIYHGPNNSVVHNLSQTPDFDEYSLSIRSNKVFFASNQGSTVSLWAASVPTKGSASVINLSKYFGFPTHDYAAGDFSFSLQRRIFALGDGSKFITDDYVCDTPNFSTDK